MTSSSLPVQILTVLIGATIAPLTAIAHHSRAHYGAEIMELDAEIMDVDWRNPHVTFTMKTTTPDGREEMWELEGGSTYMLGRYSGLGKDLFNVGDQVKIAGPVSTIRPNEMLVTNMLLPDGHEAVMLPNRPPRWTSDVEGAELSLQNNNPERTLFHVWSIDPDAPGGGGELSLTAAGEATLASYNRETDDPAMRCEKPGMPSTMSNPHPMHFVDAGDRITVNVQENDVVRTIYIGENASAAAEPASALGYSVGHWEGTTLVVTTSNINWPYYDRTGIPLSEQVTVTERFEIDDAGNHLVIHITTTDPVNFDAPAVSRRYYALLGESVKTYDCVAR